MDDLGSNEEVAVYEQQGSRQGQHQQYLGSSVVEARNSFDLDDSGLNEEVAGNEQQASRQGVHK